MIKYFIRIALRNFKRSAIYPVISVTCLALGIAISLLVAVYLRNELTYDRFHQKADRIYRVASHDIMKDQEARAPELRIPVGPYIRDNFPEVENMVRVSNSEQYTFFPQEKATIMDNMLCVDTSFLSIFNFPLISGSSKTCLQDENSIVLTEKTAKAWFGDDDPIGKTVRSNKNKVFTINGVIKDPPINSQIRFSALIPISIITNDTTRYLQWDGGPSAFTYLLLKPHTNPKVVEKKFIAMMWEKINKEYSKEGWSEDLYLQPLLKIHLNSDTDYDISPKGNRKALTVLLIIALSVLLLGCINIFNLSTQQNISRMKESAIRKISGAGRFSLNLQYIIETTLISFFSVLLGIAIAELTLPLFNKMTGGSIRITYDLYAALFCLSMAILPGLIIGLATSSQFAGLNPASIIRKDLKKIKAPVIRDTLVVVQFAITIILLICTVIMSRQVTFFLNKDMGFDKRNLKVIPLTDNLGKKAYFFRDEISKVSGVRKATLTTSVPGYGSSKNGYKPEGQETVMLSALGIDENFFETMRIPIVAGKAFTDNQPANHMAFVINETLSRKLGWKDPVGKRIERNGWYEITGVCRDFNFDPLYQKIAPLVIAPIPTSEDNFNYLLVSFETENLQASLKSIQDIWNKEEPNEPFNSFFLSQDFASVYNKEIHQRNLLLTFSILVLVISGLGLFSISLYTLSTRTKEIGVRKVNGARTSEIMFLVNKSFARWILIAFVIACPIAWYFMNKWMQGFAYKTGIDWWVFLFAGLLTLIIALITISWQAYRASSQNPIDALRYE
jgi:putative ABC transport system permease protein